MSEMKELLQQVEEIVDKKLDEKLDDKLRKVIREEIAAMAPHQCRLTITNTEAASMSKYVKSIAKLGGDDIDDGLALIRDNHKWLAGMRQGGGKAASAFFLMLVTAAASAFCVLLWEGLRAKVKGM